MKVECFVETRNKENTIPNAIFYFCEFCKIGADFNSLAYIFEPRRRNLTQKELIGLQKNIKPLDLQLDYTTYKQEGSSSRKIIEIQRKLYKLSIDNLPSTNFNEPARSMHPDNGPLLSYMDTPGFKIRESVVSDPGFQKNMSGSQQKFIDSLYTTEHISEVKIVSQNNSRFKICVDNKIYGDYRKVIVRRVECKEGDELRFPVATFVDCKNN